MKLTFSSIGIYFIFAASLAACDSNLQITTQGNLPQNTTSDIEKTLENEESSENGNAPVEKAAKLSAGADCVDPDLSKIPNDVSFTLCSGEIGHGQLDLASLQPQNCSSDGEIGCVANASYKAADMNVVLSNNIKTGATIAGIPGSVTQESHNSCLADGDVGCVVLGPTFQAANMSFATATNIKSGVTIAGVPGTYGPACSTDGGGDCLVDGVNYKAAKLSDFVAGDVKTGITIAGVPGSAILESHNDCANDGDTGCVTDGTLYKAAKLSNFQNTDIKSGVTIAGVPGSLGNCADGDSNCVVQSPTFKAAATANLTPANIKNSVTVGGVVGAYPSTTYRLANADATPDLNSANFNTQIIAGATYEWFDSTGARHTRATDSNIKAGFITPGISIYGVTGSPQVGIKRFEAQASGTSVYLSWEVIGHPAGVIIVRRQDALTNWTPTPGMTYTNGAAVDADHTVIVRLISGALVHTDTITNDGTYSYQIFAYNSSYGYSPLTLRAGVGPTATCGGSGDSCYNNEPAMVAGRATTPLGKDIEYVAVDSDFYVWKEVDGSKVLRPNGLDEWAMKLNNNGIGFSVTPFTDYRTLAGRACPPNVFIDNTDPASTDNCLYYASADRDVAFTGNHPTDSVNWYYNNQPVCTARGMRTPALFETNADPSAHANFPNADGNRVMAGSAGVPAAGRYTWTASPMINSYGDSWWV